MDSFEQRFPTEMLTLEQLIISYVFLILAYVVVRALSYEPGDFEDRP